MPRQFSEHQLHDLSKPLAQLALEAIAAGDNERCLDLLRQMAGAHAALHALGTATLARIWGKWYREQGEDATAAMLSRIGARMAEPYVHQLREGQVGGAIADLLAVFKHQMGTVIEILGQEGEALRLLLSPCGSGGTFLRRGYETKYPQWHTRFSDGTPVFCRGCKAVQEGVNQGCGETFWRTEVSAEVAGDCAMTFTLSQTEGRAVFSAEALADLTSTRIERAIALAEAGDFDIAHLIDHQHRDWRPWHDTIMCWNEYTFAACIEFGGMDYLEDCLKECYDSAFAFIYQSMESFASDADRLVALAQNWHYHQGAFRLEEEEDRFVFILDPCGSGGRLFREEMHKDMFHYGGDLAPITREPHRLTFKRTDFPTYCVHCASGNIDQFSGNPLVFVIDGHAQLRRGMACRQYVWKKGAPRRVEQRLLDQVGMAELIPIRQLP